MGWHTLYHNNGDGTFTDVTQKAGLTQKESHPRWNTGCCFVDYDRDGHLDLFVANYVNFDLKTTPVAGNWKMHGLRPTSRSAAIAGRAADSGESRWRVRARRP